MSAAGHLIVVARWQTSAADLPQVLSLVDELRPKSLAEPGCLAYEVYQHVGTPGSLLLLERYRDAAALEAHKQSDHYQALVVGRVLPLLTGRQVEVLQAPAPA
jgi:quinol monooxygenase YgiN